MEETDVRIDNAEVRKIDLIKGVRFREALDCGVIDMHFGTFLKTQK